MDPLTGVYSRATLEQRLSEEIERAQRYDLPFSIILLDLDHYKSINDAFGHLRGDQILVDFVTRLRTTIRKSDIFFRYGGDEFLLLLPNTPKDQAVQLAERLLEAVKSAPFGFNPPLSVTASMGVASAPGDGRTAETLFERADQRHYEAKRRGRSRVIGEDGQNEALLPYDDQARLLERDSALTTIQTYLRQLPIQRRGILTISGPPGSGKTRLLAEAGKIARLQGFEVINLHGSPALKNRIFGDLNDVYKQWDILPPPSVGEQVFGNALQSLVEEKGRSGLLFAVDNLHEVDWYTLEMLRQFILSSQPGIVLGLAFTADPSQARRLLASALPLQLSIELEALTLAGFKIWLRTLLQWEAPEELANWLYEQTGGLPSYLYHGLVDLIQRGLLERTQDGWTFNQELSHIRLSERLGFQIAPIPNTLPAPSTGFVGRQDEIQTAKDLIKRGRILTIVGPGGVGKTRLALQTGSELLEEFPQGVFWVPLAALAAADSLVTALAKALNFTFYNRDDPEIQLFNYLREKQLLLVVDNFEHLIDRAGLFSRLVEAAPGVKLLVTSIERLNLRGEAVLELHGMGFPKQLNTQSLESFPAVQLFVQSAQRANPGFTLSGDCRSAAVRICQLVEGLPLGIELATAWIRVLSCQEIAEEIEHSMDFLVANSSPPESSSSWQYVLSKQTA